AAAPVRHHALRRAGAATPARGRLLPGGGRGALRVLGPEPLLPPLQATRRCHAGAVPDAHKNRLTATSPSKNPGREPSTIPSSSGRAAPESRRVRVPVRPTGSLWRAPSA